MVREDVGNETHVTTLCTIHGHPIRSTLHVLVP